MSAPSASADPAARRRTTRRLTLILGTLSAIGPFSIDMYLPAFPSLASSLGVAVSAVELTLATYLAGLAVGQLIYGPLADRLGRRLPLLAGLSLYVAGSLACAAAPSLPLLALARFVQALGGCAGIVVARAVVRDHFDERASAGVYSSLILVMGAAPIVAPLVGAELLEHTGWRSIFVVLAAIGASMLAMVATGLPESLPPPARRRQSLPSLLRSAGGLLRNLPFVRHSIAGGALQAAMFAYIAGSPFVLIEYYGLPAERFGVVFGANAFGLIAASQLNRLLTPRLGVGGTLRLAIAAAATVYAGLFLAIRAEADLAVVLSLLFVGIALVGFVFPNATALAMAPFDEEAGLASALLGTLQTCCGALAATLVSALSDGSARPMATVMFGCGLAALAAAAPLGRARRPAPAGTPADQGAGFEP